MTRHSFQRLTAHCAWAPSINSKTVQFRFDFPSLAGTNPEETPPQIIDMGFRNHHLLSVMGIFCHSTSADWRGCTGVGWLHYRVTVTVKASVGVDGFFPGWQPHAYPGLGEISCRCLAAFGSEPRTNKRKRHGGTSRNRYRGRCRNSQACK